MELSYVGTVNIAVRMVNDQYPGAQLGLVVGKSPSGPTTNPANINNLLAYFMVEGGTVTIQSTVWGEWTDMTFYDKPLGDDNAIPWPVGMDITEANELKVKAGYTDPYFMVSLRWPLFPGDHETLYIFSDDNNNIAVGTNSKNVGPIS